MKFFIFGELNTAFDDFFEYFVTACSHQFSLYSTDIINQIAKIIGALAHTILEFIKKLILVAVAKSSCNLTLQRELKKLKVYFKFLQ